MRKVLNFMLIFLLVSSLIGCANAKNSAMKVYHHKDYGYEIAYPQDYKVQISGGHSPAANPEYRMRLSLCSKDNPGLDIDSIDKINFKDKYQNIEEFISYKHLNIQPDEDIIVHDKHYKIYKLEGDEYYFSFFENDNYIFQLSSSSKTLLKAVIEYFKFIKK